MKNQERYIFIQIVSKWVFAALYKRPGQKVIKQGTQVCNKQPLPYLRRNILYFFQKNALIVLIRDVGSAILSFSA